MDINVRQIREQLSLTQLQLSQKLGCTPYIISKWERGENKPGEKLRRKIIELQKKGEMKN